jgi:POLO box duplicated region
MLVGTPPFQAKTQEDIYKKVGSRDYKWPSPDRRRICQFAKDLVADLLVDAEERPSPDDIVAHPFFTEGWVPKSLDSSIKDLAPMFTESQLDVPVHGSDRKAAKNNYYSVCRSTGVGKYENGPFWPCVGKSGGQHVVRELEEEWQRKTTPVKVRAQQAELRDQLNDDPLRTGPAHKALPRQPSRAHVAKLSSSGPSSDAIEDGIDLVKMARKDMKMSTVTSAPFHRSTRSQAAVERDAHRPTVAPASTRPRTAIRVASASRRERQTDELESRPVTAVRSQTVTEDRDMHPTVSRTRKQPSKVEILDEEQDVGPMQPDIPLSLAKTRDRHLEPTLAVAPRRQGSRRDATAAKSSQPTTIKRSVTSSELDRLAPTKTIVSAPGLTKSTSVNNIAQGYKYGDVAASAPPPVIASITVKMDRATRLRSGQGSVRGPASDLKTKQVNTKSATDAENLVPETNPEDVVARLSKQIASIGFSLRRSQVRDPDIHEKKVYHSPVIVSKWVDYTDKFGIGYVLSDGSIGCLFNDSTSCVVRGGEKHVRQRESNSYEDKDELVGQSGDPVEFYDRPAAESGLERNLVEPAAFKISYGKSGQPEKLGPGKNRNETAQRKKVTLWRKFGNYMIDRLDESVGSCEDSPDRRSQLYGPVVNFYQRFGDVGCFGFCDGLLQFNFPDHTKLIISPKADVMHFLILPKGASAKLARGETATPAMLEQRITTSGSTTALLLREMNEGAKGQLGENKFRAKVEWVKSVIDEWVANNGIGCRAAHSGVKRYNGPAERSERPKPGCWVTLGARGGDGPRREEEIKRTA